ncbi:Uncharacterized protein TCM_001300 [Theobroma cacao]|uniref:Uncharacterized protein n=1 Tax=Theobroma cacao TaxID=3641 RepID=A0A061DIK3_THECC|nr:Uncharacterized protein TCM_001300 [Theobroma cacao]
MDLFNTLGYYDFWALSLRYNPSWNPSNAKSMPGRVRSSLKLKLHLLIKGQIAKQENTIQIPKLDLKCKKSNDRQMLRQYKMHLNNNQKQKIMSKVSDIQGRNEAAQALKPGEGESS